MKLSKIAIATATTGALAMGALAPAAPATPVSHDVAYSGSAWGLYSFLMTNIMKGVSQLGGGSQEAAMFSSVPFIILLLPLQMIAEAEVRLLDQLSR
ncbi:hypothetical protein [Corynebacterium haematomassiliense]|uniref:hypothetical protein n=1 Tax=Corynebacterium haemomassiliense TaxID=2754726 RepID=UPI00288A3C7F|nr:hypothetical protein [Corynebacterium haemomassiliense]